MTARRWIEIVDTSHDGLALLGADGRFEFISAIAAAALGLNADEALGLAVGAVVPEIGAAGDLLGETSQPPDPVRFEVRRTTPDDGVRSVRLTLVRRPAAHAAPGLILLTHDVTTLRTTLAERLLAQQRLTAVGVEEHRRISGEIHDGPVQILAALTLRLGATTESAMSADDIRRLQHAAEAASDELRLMINDPTPHAAADPAALLSSWALPVLAHTTLRLDIDDRSETPPNRATTEALFVFLHEIVKGALDTPSPRRLQALLSNERGGHRLDVRIPLGATDTIDDATTRTRIKVAENYARLLGGSFGHELDDDRVRTVTAWVPALAVPRPVDDEPTPVDARSGGIDAARAELGSREDLQVLTDADWEATARASHEGLMEIDADLRVTFVNAAYEQAMGRPSHELVGLPLADLFRPQDFENLKPFVRRVQGGERVRFEWQRVNATGEARWTQVAASPRRDDGGRFAGALLVTCDTTELRLVEELRDSALLDVERARRAAEQAFVRRLNDGPLRRLREVDAQLVELIDSREQSPAIRTIQAGLAESITRLQRSVGLLTAHELDGRPWDAVLRESLAAMIEAAEAELIVEDRSTVPPAPERAVAILRIAREATANAIFHGRAERVTITLSDDDGRQRLQVLDDGIGITPGPVRPNPGHLGLRSMAEWAAEQNGTIKIHPGPIGGTLVAAWFPGARAVASAPC